jgi:hypothetical protein
MRGLMFKDLMCMKKNLILFGYVVAGVLVISIMFVLSARFGNIALGSREMMETDGLTVDEIADLSTWILIVFMMLPLASIGDMVTVFEADGRAGFAKVAAVLPLSIKKRVLARYLTIFSVLGIGVVVDVLIAWILSILTVLVSFADFCGIILSAASVMGMYGALAAMFCICLGYGKDNYARLLAILLLVAAAIVVNLSKPRAVPAGEKLEFLRGLIVFLKEKFYLLLLLAAIIIVLSYGVSVFVAERKRGVV